MPLTFPASPTNNQTVTLSGTTYTYNTTKGVWEATASGGGSGFDASAFDSHILPDTNETYDIGSASKKIRDLYLSDSTLNIGTQSISANSDGIVLPAVTIGTGTNKVILSATASGGLKQAGTNSAGVAAPESTGGGVGESAPGAAASYEDMAGLIAATGMTTGQTALVTSLNRLFMYTGTGWFKIADMSNASPTDITGVNATYSLAADGTATVITVASTDPEGFPLTFSHAVTTGSLTNGGGVTATVVQGTGASKNVFTITPSSTEAYAGAFSLTFSVTDGATGAVNAVSAFTLSFAPDALTNSVSATITPTDLVTTYGFTDNNLDYAACEDIFVTTNQQSTTSFKIQAYNVSDNSLKWNVAGHTNFKNYFLALDANNTHVIIGDPLNDNGGGTNAPSYGQRGKVSKYSSTDGSLLASKTWTEIGGSSTRGNFGAGVKINTAGDKVWVVAGRAGFGETYVGKIYILNMSDLSVAHTLTGPYTQGRMGEGYQADECFSMGTDYAAVGTYNAYGSLYGAVRIFNTSDYSVKRDLVHPDGQNTQGQFGVSVAVHGDYVAVGASATTTYGHVYIFEISTGTLKATIPRPSDYTDNTFGRFIAMTPKSLVVSGPSASNMCSVFDWSDIANGNVTQTGSTNTTFGRNPTANMFNGDVIVGLQSASAPRIKILT